MARTFKGLRADSADFNTWFSVILTRVTPPPLRFSHGFATVTPTHPRETPSMLQNVECAVNDEYLGFVVLRLTVKEVVAYALWQASKENAQ